MAEKVRFGIFPKLLIFSLCVALIPLGGIVYLSFVNMSTIGELLLDQGKKSLEDLGAKVIEEKAKSVAKQLEIYIKTHPNKTIADLQKDETFKSLAVQPVGKTGYTAVQNCETAVNYFHPNPKIVNMDLHKLASKLPQFWKIMERSLGGHDSYGYYDWQDPDGRIRKKFMYITTVKARTADGVRLGVAATTYLDEFSMPMVKWESTVSTFIQRKLRLFYSIIAVTAVAVVVASLLLARAITRPILYLAHVADQISTGKLGVKIDIKSSDEIGVLITAMKRMQRSLALAIKKLREQRLTPRR
ncbi:MAG: hypothetical protein DRG69_01235 [Deltaproteobacteria bacterium]|nr:MAG: hypothetical protein DRG69_01235 [Deltaproteobacteria bacterium]